MCLTDLQELAVDIKSLENALDYLSNPLRSKKEKKSDLLFSIQILTKWQSTVYLCGTFNNMNACVLLQVLHLLQSMHGHPQRNRAAGLVQ